MVPNPNSGSEENGEGPEHQPRDREHRQLERLNLPEENETEFHEILELVPEDRRDEARTHLMSFVRFEKRVTSGPFPPAEMLDGYQRHVPDAGERMFRHAEREQEHRHAMERASLKGYRLHQVYKLIAAVLVIVICSVVGAYMAYLGATPAAVALFIGALGGIIATIYSGGRKKGESGDE